MARTNQRLINYHTSGSSTMPATSAVEFGEIVVRHSQENPELLIKVQSGETQTFAKFIDASAVAKAISDAQADVTSDIQEISGSIITLSASVVNDYATSADVETAIISAASDAYEEAVASAKSYTDTKVADFALSATVNSFSASVETKLGTLESGLEDVSAAVSATSAAVITLSGDVVSYVDSKVSSVYKYQGSVATFEDLPATGQVAGYVYNVVAAHGSTPAGTNYAWNGSEWDALGGTIDLSNLVSKDDFSAVTSSMTNQITALKSGVETLSGSTQSLETNFNSLSAAVSANYALKSEVETAANAAKDAAISSAKTYVDTKLGDYALSADVNTISGAIETRINGVVSNIETLSASTVAAETKANSALQGFELGAVSTASATQSGAKAAFTTGGTATLDLSELVIDCGDF